jgi:YD repeat-containing protein
MSCSPRRKQAVGKRKKKNLGSEPAKRAISCSPRRKQAVGKSTGKNPSPVRGDVRPRRSPPESHTYTNNGNLTSGGGNTYTWDARNQLTSVTAGRTPIGSFKYDAFGTRYTKPLAAQRKDFRMAPVPPGRPYSSENRHYETDFEKVYDSVLRYMKLCGIKP